MADARLTLGPISLPVLLRSISLWQSGVTAALASAQRELMSTTADCLLIDLSFAVCSTKYNLFVLNKISLKYNLRLY